ncbi:MAG: M20/M25/M40 family metallo-hydrolase [Proteobacteria bacterium]|nr:M20/M25/M40 family metallo-hydrolase [Pseudomonadota bacterium]
MKKFKKVLLALVAVIAAIFVVMIIRTMATRFPDVAAWDENKIALPKDFEKYVTDWAGGLKFQTVSHADVTQTDFAKFAAFRDYLKTAYPTVFKNMEFNLINDNAMVLVWRGKNPDLKPILFNAHYDVVPAGDAGSWKYPPFSGTISGDRVYGRGTFDDKGMLFALLGASESLMGSGFQPVRDVYFVFNPDEEIDSKNGAQQVAAHLSFRGLKFDAIYDEGGLVNLMEINGATYGFAMIGVSEKGFVTLRITVRGDAGHSSVPAARTALGDAAAIMQRLEKNQMPARILPETDALLRGMGAASGFFTKFMVANRDVMRPVLMRVLSNDPATNAVIRTTIALVGADAGAPGVDNVMPDHASIVVNFRLQPGDKIDDVVGHVKQQLNGFDADVEIVTAWDAAPVSKTDTRGFHKMTESIASVFPTAIIVPFVTIGGTDSRNYRGLGDNIYRFLPAAMTTAERETMHGYNESMSIDNYARMILYFESLIKNYDQ